MAYGSGRSVEYLSVHIPALDTGFFLDQTVYTKDFLSKWSMDECRPLGSLDDIAQDIVEDDEPLLENVRKAQTLAGGLNWLATRTRPDLVFYVSQLASAATQCPLSTAELGKT